jgi:hypothetical protein
MKTKQQAAKVEQAVEEAEFAFWETIAGSFRTADEPLPPGRGGKLDAAVAASLKREMREAAARWSHLNNHHEPCKHGQCLSCGEGCGRCESVHFDSVLANLHLKGQVATIEQTGGGIECIVVPVGRYRLYFGTANETWGADVYYGNEFLDGRSVETDCVSEGSDAGDVAQALICAAAEFQADNPADGHVVRNVTCILCGQQNPEGECIVLRRGESLLEVALRLRQYYRPNVVIMGGLECISYPYPNERGGIDIMVRVRDQAATIKVVGIPESDWKGGAR